MFDGVYWIHQVDEGSINAFKKNPSLKCTRNFDNNENKHLFFKKLMLDLCEDIAHIKTNKNILMNKKKCPKILARLQYRKETLMQFFYASYYKDMFDIKDECSISFINDNFSDISCNNVKEQSKTTGPSEGERVTASSSADRADQLQDSAKETGELQDSAHGDGLDDPGPVDPIPEDLEISLPFNEDPPKLDTTYAAASLAGISLFGTILYKVKCHYINEILYKSFIFYVNIII
ncbi:hypothetical protein PVIIG_05768 [Plasmodium vivax India VII]|uniref:Uncharacterized protein n=1 Tax=Plasmodium vivax India VII TaxID=1077284 RepID=A0A0J9UV95_PLAVI|nr:hypothetical protein PVIIG_05768 [Plasmodium vivax India VII]